MSRPPEPPEAGHEEGSIEPAATPETPNPEAPSSRLALSIRHGDLEVDLKIGHYAGVGPHGRSRRPRFSWPRRLRRAPAATVAQSPAPRVAEPTSSVRILRSSPVPRPEADVTASFWDALTPEEKRDFQASADIRTFAAGSKLMHEGETADHVIVILDGYAEIWIEEIGRAHV